MATSGVTKMRKSTPVRVGKLVLGGGNPIRVQSMTNTRTEDLVKTVRQVRRLEAAGCEIVRVAVPTMEAAANIAAIKKRMSGPLVADIHFNHRIAIAAIEAGADKIRINPGNIGGPKRLAEVARAAKERGIPIRVGVNSGSLEEDLLEKYGHPSADALVESALRNVGLLEDMDFTDIVVSLKSTYVPTTIESYRKIASKVRYPLHLGLTEAGLPGSGTIKSAITIGLLLAEGIGDTIRVSLTSSPIEEVRVARQILQALGMRRFGPEVISCPTCGRLQIDLISLTREVEKRLRDTKKDITVAILGCAVNGPGEAREADIGIAAGKGSGFLIRKGEFVRKVREEDLLEALMEEIENFSP